MDPDINEILEADGDEEEVEMTPAELLRIMEESWLNEKFAPEILPNKADFVECLLGQISYMEENIESVKAREIRKVLHQLEVDRLRFLVSSYLRTRLEKIETFADVILKQEEARREAGEEPYLTEDELKFAKSYKEILDKHFENVIDIHAGLPTEEWKSSSVTPNIHSFVFSRSKKDTDGIVIDDGSVEGGDVVYVNKDSQMIMSYKSIAELVKKGDVHLI